MQSSFLAESTSANASSTGVASHHQTVTIVVIDMSRSANGAKNRFAISSNDHGISHIGYAESANFQFAAFAVSDASSMDYTERRRQPAKESRKYLA
jgi:hypothetical protein